MIDKNIAAFRRAKKYIAGGVNSPVRSFAQVGTNPKFIKKGKGSKIYDINAKKYIDYVGSWGPMILGHADKEVIKAVQKQAKKGLSFGAPTKLETKLAQQISKMMPQIEKIRFVNSGTEATMSAIRLARGFSQKDKIVKFIGCYHGHSDGLLASSGSGILTLSKPSSAGIPKEVIKHTHLLEYNNSDDLERYFEKFGKQTACVIIEPIAANMNLIPAEKSFLKRLRELCDHYHCVLIFDEVMSGFRVAKGGASEIYGINPDLVTLGKVIGGGMPIGAFGGKKEIMNHIAPDGDVYQAGTLSGNPISMIAGLTTLKKIDNDQVFKQLNEQTKKLIDGFNTIAQQKKFNFYALSVGSLFGLFFCAKFNANHPISRFSQLENCDKKAFNQFFNLMLDAGIYFAPSSFEAGFVSLAHSDKDIAKTLAIFAQSLDQMQK